MFFSFFVLVSYDHNEFLYSVSFMCWLSSSASHGVVVFLMATLRLFVVYFFPGKSSLSLSLGYF